MTFSFMTGVAVSPTTFHSHTPSLDKVMLRVQSKIPTANAYVGTAHMRALRPQRSAKRKQMHSLKQMGPQLWRKTLDMVTVMGMVTIMDITMVMVMATVAIIMVFIPVALAMAMTMEHRGKCKMVGCLKGNNRQI